MRIRLILVALAAAALLDPSPILAQDADDVGHGREIAQTICAACHVVAKAQLVSPNSEAPPFPVLAATPGMTAIALTAALLTSHRLMPNIVLQPDERRDVIAYISTACMKCPRLFPKVAALPRDAWMLRDDRCRQFGF